MLNQPWCDLAVCEIGGRRTGAGPPEPDRDVYPYGHPRWSQWIRDQAAYRKTPAAGGGVLDVLGITTEARARDRQFKGAVRIAIAEVKVQRSDLRQDLKRGKLLRYEPQASRVYLSLTPEALDAPEDTDYVPAVADLASRGLPAWWGIILIRWRRASARQGLSQWPICIRPARAYGHGCEPTAELRASLTNRAAVSLAHRALRYE